MEAGVGGFYGDSKAVIPCQGLFLHLLLHLPVCAFSICVCI
jgi:hypothetical protein